MSDQFRLFIRHLSILVLTTFIVCYTTTQLSHASNLFGSANSLGTNNYRKLNNALRIYEAAARNPWPVISIHKILKPGQKSEMVPLLRERLQLTGDLGYTRNYDDQYDYALADAVVSFQERHGLKADAAIGSNTLAELNVPPQERIRQIQINMERWAKLNNELGNRYIIVNIPDYNVSLFENDQRILSLKAIVGKPTWQTPQLQSRVTRLVFYPYWHVPAKIAKKDILPKIEEDPDYLDNMNIKVIKEQSGTKTEVNEEDINWDDPETDHYEFRQDPGELNALGIVKFEFPNPYDVYMHDTSAKDLFNTYPRDLSHGCVRIEKPFDLVNYLMKNDDHWSSDRIKDIMDSKKTVYVRIPQPIPIIITYITAWVDDTGKINFRDDIYHLDQQNSND